VINCQQFVFIRSLFFNKINLSDQILLHLGL